MKLVDNECRPFGEEVQILLSRHFGHVKDLDGGSYRKNYKNDVFWTYYSSDRSNMNKLGMEKMESLAHRFDAWRVSMAKKIPS